MQEESTEKIVSAMIESGELAFPLKTNSLSFVTSFIGSTEKYYTSSHEEALFPQIFQPVAFHHEYRPFMRNDQDEYRPFTRENPDIPPASRWGTSPLLTGSYYDSQREVVNLHIGETVRQEILNEILKVVTTLEDRMFVGNPVDVAMQRLYNDPSAVALEAIGNKTSAIAIPNRPGNLYINHSDVLKPTDHTLCGMPVYFVDDFAISGDMIKVGYMSDNVLKHWPITSYMDGIFTALGLPDSLMTGGTDSSDDEGDNDSLSLLE